MHVEARSDRAGLRWLVERLTEELRDDRPGAALVADHLAHLMLVEALRLHGMQGVDGRVGWLYAMADRRMSAAISAIHGDPARAWTLDGLARHVGMSRSSFAARFQRSVGEPPMAYLTRWRMLLAGDRLARTRDPVSAVARFVGYGSESAFSNAFRRVMGCPPRQHATTRRARQRQGETGLRQYLP